MKQPQFTLTAATEATAYRSLTLVGDLLTLSITEEGNPTVVEIGLIRHSTYFTLLIAQDDKQLHTMNLPR
jgi:hypothetical protein